VRCLHVVRTALLDGDAPFHCPFFLNQEEYLSGAPVNPRIAGSYSFVTASQCSFIGENK